MATSPDPVTYALEDANRRLAFLDPTPFSSAAFAVLRAIILGFIAELIAESRRVAQRYRADTVSAAHVERAGEYLVTSSTRRLFRHLGTVGGILLGAGLSTLLSMATSETFARLPTLLAMSIGVVGAFLVALHIARD